MDDLIFDYLAQVFATYSQLRCGWLLRTLSNAHNDRNTCIVSNCYSLVWVLERRLLRLFWFLQNIAILSFFNLSYWGFSRSISKKIYPPPNTPRAKGGGTKNQSWTTLSLSLSFGYRAIDDRNLPYALIHFDSLKWLPNIAKYRKSHFFDCPISQDFLFEILFGFEKTSKS